MAESAGLLVSVSLEDGDATELDELTRELRGEIEQLNVDSVDSVSMGSVPVGAKAAEWAALGSMAVTVAPAVIPQVFGVLKSWIDRKPTVPVKIRVKTTGGTAEMEYDPTKTSEADLEKLVKSLHKSLKQ